MDVVQFLTTIYVSDHTKSIEWYTKFFGRSFDNSPQPNCREWEVVPKAFLQVIEEPSMKSGHAAFVVSDLIKIVNRIESEGIAVEKKKIGEYQVTQCKDPDGNVITLLASQ